MLNEIFKLQQTAVKVSPKTKWAYLDILRIMKIWFYIFGLSFFFYNFKTDFYLLKNISQPI